MSPSYLEESSRDPSHHASEESRSDDIEMDLIFSLRDLDGVDFANGVRILFSFFTKSTEIVDSLQDLRRKMNLTSIDFVPSVEGVAISFWIAHPHVNSVSIVPVERAESTVASFGNLFGSKYREISR